MTTWFEPRERPAETRGHSTLRRRIAGAFALDSNVFEAVEHDPTAFSHAAAIVVIAGVARGVFVYPSDAVLGMVGSVAGAIVLWLVGAALLTGVGRTWLGGTTDYPEMLRTVGFAAVPLWGLAPAFVLGGPARLVVGGLLHGWALVAAVIAVRQALDCGTARAISACALSLALGLGLLFLLGVPLAH